MKIVLMTLNAKYIHSSLALRYLKAFCCGSFPDIHNKEYTINNNLLEILSDLYREKPDIVGMACYIWNIDMILELASLLKKVLPEIKIVLGGPEVSYDGAELLRQNKFLDYIICGEGEEILLSLLLALQEQKSSKDIKGLITNQSEDVLPCAAIQVVDDLSKIPFPYQHEEMKNLDNKIIYYESSRGCPFSCQYCLSSATQGVRYLTLERVFADMTFFIEHNVRQVKFVDRTFNAKKAHFLPLLQFLARQTCRTNFHFELAIDLLDEETLEFLRKVTPGRFQFEVGIQSTHLSTLGAVQRHNNWHKIVYCIEQLKSFHNIHLHLDLIVGLPYEDYPTFAHSFNDVYALKPDKLQIGFLKLLKGSGLREAALTHQYVYMDHAPYEVLSNAYLTYDEVRRLKMLEDVFEKTYNSGFFVNTLEWFISLENKNAFVFYEKLTAFWEKNGWQLQAHSVVAIFQLLLAYCKSYYPQQVLLCHELLKFDALLSGNQLRPEFLAWNQEKWKQEISNFWRDETKVKKYIPHYKFVNWRELKKQYHIEVFDFDVCSDYGNGKAVKKMSVLLFSYERDVVTYQYIDDYDLWVKEG